LKHSENFSTNRFELKPKGLDVFFISI